MVSSTEHIYGSLPVTSFEVLNRHWRLKVSWKLLSRRVMMVPGPGWWLEGSWEPQPWLSTMAGCWKLSPRRPSPGNLGWAWPRSNKTKICWTLYELRERSGFGIHPPARQRRCSLPSMTLESPGCSSLAQAAHCHHRLERCQGCDRCTPLGCIFSSAKRSALRLIVSFQLNPISSRYLVQPCAPNSAPDVGL